MIGNISWGNGGNRVGSGRVQDSRKGRKGRKVDGGGFKTHTVVINMDAPPST